MGRLLVKTVNSVAPACSALAAVVLILSSETNAAEARTPIPPSAKDFMMAASQSDQYEILAGQVALAQSKTQQITAFAQAMIDDHHRMQRNLAQAAAEAGLTPPEAAMSSDQAALLAALQGLRGSDFDKAYARQQALVHAQAVAVERSYADLGADPNLRTVAKSTVPLIQQHLEMARQLSTAINAD